MRDIYVQLEGELFEAVQLSNVFADSKTFVDAVPKSSSREILDKYHKLRNTKSFDLEQFILDNFSYRINTDDELPIKKSNSLTQHINDLWTILRRVPDTNIDNSTLIALPYPYIVPGGRFTEIYYWDSYFTAEGLVVAGQIEMVLNMLKNFAYLIDEYGFIPNGNRLYYLSRSQPPFFCSMLELVERNLGFAAIKPYLVQLEKEYEFWMRDGHKIVLNEVHCLNRYWDSQNTPREESYREDLLLGEKSNIIDFYRNTRAACESGWDFSSRWFGDGESLLKIDTTNILPIDLNSILYNIENKLSIWLELDNKPEQAAKYELKAKMRLASINYYFWNNEFNYFFDYSIKTGITTSSWSLAGVYPLFFKFATSEQAKEVAEHIQNKFLRPGGVVTTLVDTGQQWDSPNGWAPLQWVTIIGLRNYGYFNLANEIQQRFINLTENVYKRTGKMMEKYNVCDMSLDAGGGEYELQDGFGWTNGVVQALLKFNDN